MVRGSFMQQFLKERHLIPVVRMPFYVSIEDVLMSALDLCIVDSDVPKSRTGQLTNRCSFLPCTRHSKGFHMDHFCSLRESS